MSPSDDFFPAFQRRSARLLVLDSDGTVLDSMGWKHRTCFAPAFAQAFIPAELRGKAEECWNFVSLTSRSRGMNRYPALLASLRLLEFHPEARGFDPGDLSELEEWVAVEHRLSLPGLRARASKTGSSLLSRITAWSEEVNSRIRASGASKAFPSAAAVISGLPVNRGSFDLMVISQSVTEDLKREWDANGLASLPLCIVGQEAGSKADSIARAMASGYEDALVVGDTLQDAEAAKEAGAAFYPVIPGAEGQSWVELHESALPSFLSGSYRGLLEDNYLSRLEAALPPEPAWKASSGLGRAPAAETVPLAVNW